MAKTVETPRTGLFLRGTVIGRRRKEFKQEGSASRYQITLSVLTDKGPLLAETWADRPMPDGLPIVNETVDMPVTGRAFASKAGAQFRLSFGDEVGGEAF